LPTVQNSPGQRPHPVAIVDNVHHANLELEPYGVSLIKLSQCNKPVTFLVFYSYFEQFL
jgi:hypothetical protein